jgi:hypothetical protein
MSSPDARRGSPAERFTWVRELGSCATPTWAALESSPHARPLLVVVERLARPGSTDDIASTDAARRARSLATLRHANVGRIRDVVTTPDEVLVVREFIDGTRFRELVDGPQRLPLEITLRALVDVLSGLAAMHGLRGDGGQGPNLFHGRLTPDCIFVTPTGAARMVVSSRLSAGSRVAKADDPYLAPELLLEDDEADARSDVYGVGVMLWEALSGKSLFGGMQPSAIVTHLLSGRVTRAPTPPDTPWAAPLADVAARALMPEASKRFQSAAAMAAEIRRVASGRVALTGRVAAHIGATYGDVVRKRREQLEQGYRAPSKAPAAPVVEELGAGDFVEEPPISAQSRPTPIVPPPFATSAPRPWNEGAEVNPIAVVTAPMAFEPIPMPLPIPPVPSQAIAAPGPVATPTFEPVAAPSREVLAASSMAPTEPEYAFRRPRPHLAFALVGFFVVVVGGVAWWLAMPAREGAHASTTPPLPVRSAITPGSVAPTAQPVSVAPTAQSVSGAAVAQPDATPATEPQLTVLPVQDAIPAASAVDAPGSVPESSHPAVQAPAPLPSPATHAAPAATSAPVRPKHNYDPEGI